MSSGIDKLHGKVSAEAEKNITAWLTDSKYRQYVSEVEQLINDEQWKQLEDSFFKIIEFGTAGRRGTTGAGSNRINKVTIGESAQALCSYVKSFDEAAPTKGVVIAYDTRLTSSSLSQFTAQVCAANGFKVYLFDEYRSTPELSFAVRHLGAAIGIVISASHNPPSDNGFKAYWSDGGQLVAPHDKGVLLEAEKITEILETDFKEAVSADQIVMIGKEVDQAYYQAAIAESESSARDINIIYSPLHGAGQTNVLPVLQQAGFHQIQVVGEQMIPDGNFPTIPTGKPNPEEKAANDMAVQYMLDKKADIAITNDPDADRFGIIVRTQDGPVYVTGNQAAVLATDYVLKTKQEKGELTPLHYITKTIVTSDMLNALAADYGVRMYDNLLIGFKYIGELIHKKEDTSEIFLIGGEESFGLLKGVYVRDKDGASGSLMLAEYAAKLKAEGKTLHDRLGELFVEYGVYVETLANVQFPGADGFEKMQKIMAKLRTATPATIAGYEVSVVSDYKDLIKRNVANGETGVIDCIPGDVIVFEFGDARRRVTIRPSGTEPKLKLYVQWYEDVSGGTAVDAHEQHSRLLTELDQFVRAAEEQLTS
jgi:phosphoglucomutase